MGPDAKKIVKPVCSDTETSFNIETACYRRSYYTFQRVNNKGADQTVRMRRLVCDFVVLIQVKFSHIEARIISVYFCLYNIWASL